MVARKEPMLVRFWLPIILAGLSLLGTAWVSTEGSTPDAKVTARITQLELKQEELRVHQQDDLQRLDRIEAKLDRLIYYLTGLKQSQP